MYRNSDYIVGDVRVALSRSRSPFSDLRIACQNGLYALAGEKVDAPPTAERILSTWYCPLPSPAARPRSPRP